VKNLIGEKPSDPIYGRALYGATFISDRDINQKNILDIGCGFGWFEFNLLKRGAENIVGLEVSADDLDTVRRYIHHPKVFFKIGSALDLPLEANAFDTAVAWEIIEHIPKNTEDKMFQEVNRVLKDGGAFYLSTPFKSFLGVISDPAWWLIGHRHYSAGMLISLAQRKGFIVKKILVNGGWWETLRMNNLYLSKWIFKRRPFFEKYLINKLDAEYKKERGFTNIFVKFVKCNGK
jgi:SAM-dependent methyltransferase